MSEPKVLIDEDDKREPDFGEEYDATRPGLKTLVCVLFVIGLLITSDYWLSIV